MKVSSLTKEETLYLLDLYKELHKVEEELDDYISNTAYPEVSNIKKSRELVKQSSEEATEILNSDISKDSKKMISLLEDLNSSIDEIEKGKEKSQKIMYIIEELNDKKRDIEDEIRVLLSRGIIERKYDSEEIINSNKCKIIYSDKNLIYKIVIDFGNKIKYLLTPRNDDMIDELIKIVDEHVIEKKKEEEEKLRIVEMENNKIEESKEPEIKNEETIVDNTPTEEEKKLDEQVEDKTTQIDLPTEEPKIETLEVSQDTNINIPEEKVEINEPSQTIIEENKDVAIPLENIIENSDDNSKSLDTPFLDNLLNGDSNTKPIINEPSNEQINNNTKLEPNNEVWIDTDIQDKKVAKVPSQKKENVFNTWNGYYKPRLFKPIENINNESNESTNVNPVNFNIENFATNKAA